MKNFSTFLKEEIDLKGNSGIPDNFTDNADRQARKNLGVNIDNDRDTNRLVREIGESIHKSMELLFQGIPPQQIGAMFMGRGPVPTTLEEKYVKLEALAKKIILDEYSDILDASEKPVELNIKIIRPGKKVEDEIPDMDSVPSFPSKEEIQDPELRKAVDKKKILNVINQGEAKATKNIIRDSSLVEEGLSDIFGDNWRDIYDAWLETTDIANKMDWTSPIELKSKMMKDAPEGMAGACQVKWEKDQEDEEETHEEETQEEGYTDENGTQMVGDQEDFDRIVINAVGVDFPMLIHEAVKGIWSLIKSGSIKENEEIAKLIAQNTSSFEDESQDFRYGVAIQAMFRDFIAECKGSDKYSQMRLRVYGALALDKDRDGKFSDGEFLELSKEMFSTFDLVNEGNKLEFTLNLDRFNSSRAKRTIESIIEKIINVEKDYEDAISKWDLEQSEIGSKDYDSNDDSNDDDFNNFLGSHGISGAKKEEEEEEIEDLSTMSQREIQGLVDDALDAGDYKEVERVSKYLKEGAEIYLIESRRLQDLSVRRKI